MKISMTWPEYLAGCCRIGGRLTRLTFAEADTLLALLLSNPECWTSTTDLVEKIWPNADRQPNCAHGMFFFNVARLRRHGIVLEARRGEGGYRIPRHARGRPEHRQMAA